MRKALFTLPVVCLCAVLAHAGNWERYRGPNGVGSAADKNIPVKFGDGDGIPLKLPIAGVGNSSPVIWGNHLFLQTSTANGDKRLLVCIDVAKGKELWSRGIPAAKGQIHPKSSLASATPATDGEIVVVPFWDGKGIQMVAYDFKGTLLWNKGLGGWASQHGPGSSPIIYKDKVIFSNDMDKEHPKTKAPVDKPSTLYALNKKTGEIEWEVPREAFRACYSMPFLMEKDGVTHLVVTSTTSITSYNPDDGSQNWKWHWSFKSKMPLRTIGAPALLGNMLFPCSGDGGGDRQMAAVELTGTGKNLVAKQVWENRKDFPYVPCVLTRGEHLYFVNDAGFAGCYEAKTGKRVFLERYPDAAFTASPVMIDGKIYAPSEQGDVYVFAANPQFTPLAKNSLGERIRATPAVADGKLYIRGQNHLFCIGTK